MKNELELGLLRTFVAVAEEENFGRAAKRLATSQSAVSVRIQRLEDVLDTKVMERDRNRLSLTPMGEVVLQEAYNLIGHSEQVLEKIRVISKGHRVEARIASTQRAMTELAPKILALIQREVPKVRLPLEALPTPDQVAAISKNEIDIGILQLPIEANGIATMPIAREPLVVAMRRTDPLAKKRKLNWVDLQERQITLSPSQRMYTPFLDALVAKFNSGGIEPTFDQQDIRFRSIMAYLLTSESLALVPRSAICGPETLKREIKDPLLVEFAIAWKAQIQKPLISQLISIISKHFTPASQNA